jgi:hypothetical protein
VITRARDGTAVSTRVSDQKPGSEGGPWARPETQEARVDVTAAPSRRLRTTAFGVVWLIFLLLVLEALSFGVIALVARLGREEIRRTADIFQEQSQKIQKLLEPGPKLLQLDPELGWRYRAGYRDARNQMNAQGLRSRREYSTVPAPGVVRVAAFGDSFVYCNEVADDDSWPATMEAMFPRVEVLNYGVGGYGTDQAFLRYLAEGSSLSPRVVVIGFPAVDLGRTINVYRRFVSNRELPLAKPRFVLGADGELALLPSPLRGPSDYERYLREPARIVELGRHDWWYQPAVYENPLFDYSASVRVFVTLGRRIQDRYLDPGRPFDGNVLNPSSTAFKIQTAVFEKFARTVEAAGARPVVVIFPDRDAIEAARRGRSGASDPLVAHLRGKGIITVDLTDAFLSEGGNVEIAKWFMPRGHYSPLANRRVASTLGRYVVDMMTADAGRRPGGAE